MPVPGTMSSVNWITLQNPDPLFRSAGSSLPHSGRNVLENTQLEPDIKVANHPADIVKGIDAQPEAAGSRSSAILTRKNEAMTLSRQFH